MSPIQIVDLAGQPSPVLEQASTLLVEAFHQPHGWPTMELAREEVATVQREGFARGMVDGDKLLGWIGGLPEYNGRVWELHPLVVRPEHRRLGYVVTGVMPDANGPGRPDIYMSRRL